MHFEHTNDVWTSHPGLNALALVVTGVRQMRRLEDHSGQWLARAERRISSGPESAMPEIAAWRDAFGKMGLKPTQYRCASEALIRRYRKEKSLPALHPLVDLLNVVSMAYAIPIAVFDSTRIGTGIAVRPATGGEIYETFQGEKESPERGEIIFADEAGNAHSRRWTHRQSARSAVNGDTATALIVAEALHPGARSDIASLERELTPQLREAGLTTVHVMKIDTERRRLEF
jgi:DNA/RNA-binding domain of Phe-tRNA-synthetase-like protein